MGTIATVGYQSGIDGATDDLAPPLAELAEDSIGGAVLAALEIDDPEAAGSLLAAANQAFVDGASNAFTLSAIVAIIMAGVMYRFYPKGQI